MVATRQSHVQFAIRLTPRSRRVFADLLALGEMIGDLSRELPWREDLREARRVLIDLAANLDLQVASAER